MNRNLRKSNPVFPSVHARKWMLLFFMTFFSIGIRAQDGFAVTGTVVGSDGNPIPGATAVEAGTRNGTSTDANGNYRLQVFSADAALEFSFMGHVRQRVPVRGKRIIDVTLEEESTAIDDVVVIGYGTARKSDLTGSVSSVKSADLQDKAMTSIEDALKGRIAGVHITTADGQPGESLNIRIRGTGSINASNEPLYVIDGVPMDNADLNPGEVESIEILKDASATAIYGSRGANGVIMVTTKRGQKGAPRINFSVNSGWQQPVRLIEMMNGWQYAEHRYRQSRVVSQRSDNPLITNGYTGYYDKYGNIWQYPASHSFRDWETFRDPGAVNTDWQDVMLRDTWTHDIRANISGGNDRSIYSFMGNIYKNEGMIVNSGFTRYSVRTNLQQEVTKNLVMTFNFSATTSDQNGTVTNESQGTIMNMLTQMPVKPMNYSDDIEVIDGESTVINNNPWYHSNNVIRNVKKDKVVFTTKADWNLTRDLKLSVSGNYNYNVTAQERYNPSGVNSGRDAKGIVRNNRTIGKSWLNENLLYYTPKAFGIHKVDVMGGVTFSETNNETMNVQGQNIQYDALKEYGLNTVLTPMIPAHTLTANRMISFLGRANYTIAGRYYFTASMRSDGSSRFGANNKWGIFPSGAFAWRISEEKALKQIAWISNLKLRLSAGVSGNTAIPAYQTLALLNIANYPFAGKADDLSLGVRQDRVGNPELKWETSTQYDIGFDFGFFRNRFNGSVDLYQKMTRDLLMSESVPYYSGFATRWSNVGAVDNRGVEVTLNADVLRNKAFNWMLSYNMGFNRSQVKHLGEREESILSPGGPVASGYSLLRVGHAIGTWYGFQTDGLFRTYDQINALPNGYISQSKTKSAIQPGMQRYVDQNGDNVIDANDRVVLGTAEPKFTGGIQSDLTWKGFGLLVNLEFSYGAKVFNATALNLERTSQVDNHTLRYYQNRWTPTLYDMTTGVMVWEGNEDDSWLPSMSYSHTPENILRDYYLEDGSYLRISDVTFSYTFKQEMLKKYKIKALKLYVSGKNLHVFTRYSGYDPDVNSVSGNTSLAPGVDNASYPRSRVISFGINLTL